MNTRPDPTEPAAAVAYASQCFLDSRAAIDQALAGNRNSLELLIGLAYSRGAFDYYLYETSKPLRVRS